MNQIFRTVHHLRTLVLISMQLILANGLTKHAFQIGQVGERFGVDCAKETEQWERRGDGAIWGCSHQWGCAVSKEFRSRLTVDEDKTMHIIPNVTRSHFGTYSCQTNPFNIGANENKKFDHQVTVYESLQCKDNVTIHRAGDTIELQCTVLHWGDGDPDLKFHLFDVDGSILRDEITLDKRVKSLYLTTKLDRYHHGKRFGCSFLGFDGVEVKGKPQNCMITEDMMNVLHSPMITRGPNGVKIVGEGDLLDFECTSEGNPAPQSSFLLNGDQLTRGRRVKAERTLRNITCIAENQIGKDSSTQIINVLSFTPVYPDIRTTEGENVNLACDLEQSNPNSEKISVVRSIGNIEIYSEKTSIRVDNLFDEKKLKCSAVNNLGQVVYEKEAANGLDISYGPFVNCTQQTVNKWTDNFEIVCYVAKNPHPTVADIVLKRPTGEIIVTGMDGITIETMDIRNKKIAVVVRVTREQMKKVMGMTLTFSAGLSVGNDLSEVKDYIAFSYVEPENRLDVGLIAGASVGAVLLLLIIVLWLTLIVKGAICGKSRVIEKEASIVNGPSISKGRNDAIHGTPPVTAQSMNGYVNKAAAKKNDGLVFADLTFNESQPRSRAPILDFTRYEFELNPDRLAAV